jgi:hypothetical protein
MKINEARIGVRVKSLVDFSGVPKGTEGVIDEDYGTGVMVAWDLSDQPLPIGYSVYTGKPAFVSGILRDGFDRKKDLHFLEKV